MNSKTALAFVIAPLMTPITFVITVAFRGGLLTAVSVAPLILALYTPFAYLAAVILGLPTFLISRALGCKNSIFYMLGGTAIGWVTMLLLDKFTVGWEIPPEDCLWGAIAGGASSFVFWLIIFKINLKESSAT